MLLSKTLLTVALSFIHAGPSLGKAVTRTLIAPAIGITSVSVLGVEGGETTFGLYQTADDHVTTFVETMVADATSIFLAPPGPTFICNHLPDQISGGRMKCDEPVTSGTGSTEISVIVQTLLYEVDDSAASTSRNVKTSKTTAHSSTRTSSTSSSASTSTSVTSVTTSTSESTSSASTSASASQTAAPSSSQLSCGSVSQSVTAPGLSATNEVSATNSVSAPSSIPSSAAAPITQAGANSVVIIAGVAALAGLNIIL